jgi:hypothetical protein
MTEHLSDCDGNGSIPCWECGGEGDWHDCGEDCCCCLDADGINHTCPTCRGTGWVTCPGCNEKDGGES